MGANNHLTVVPGDGSDDEENSDDRPSSEQRLENRFQVRDCYHCGRTTVVDSEFNDQRCDWVDTCGLLFAIGDTELSDDAWFEDGELVRGDDGHGPEVRPNYGVFVE